MPAKTDNNMVKTKKKQAKEGRKRPPAIEPCKREIRAGTNCTELMMSDEKVILSCDYLQCQNPKFYDRKEILSKMIVGLAAFLPARNNIVREQDMNLCHASVQDTEEN